MKGPLDARRMKMSATVFFVVCLIVLKKPINAGTGSKVQSSCSLKCDLVQEITLLRQLVNQESLLRIGLDAQLQELRSQVKQNGQQITIQNASLEAKSTILGRLERGMEAQLAEVKTSIRRTENTIQGLEQATDTRISAVENGNKNSRQKLQALERDLTSLNQTSRVQGMYKCLWYMYIYKEAT